MIRVVGSAWTGLAAALALGLLSSGSALGEPGDAVAAVRMEARDAAQRANPRIVVGQSKAFGYNARCLDTKGKKIREALRVFISGNPTTGGATASLRPRPVFTNMDFDVVIGTKEETKPGAYAMTITVYGGTRCGLIGRVQQGLDLAPKIKVSGAAVVWWFKGEKPAGYDTSLKVFAMGPGGQPYTWRITRGADKAKIVKPVSNTAEVEGLSGSEGRNDVSIKVASGGVESDAFSLTVNAPRSLTFLRNVDRADATWGYETKVHYAIKDQFGRILPSSVPLNEHFTTPVTKQFPGTNWRRGPNGGATVGPADWVDQIQGERVGMGYVPAPQAPRNPRGVTRVYRWDGEWSIGSADPTGGKGVRVSKNTWQKFRDHARHTNFVSPAP